MSSETCSENGGTSGTVGTLLRVQAEIAAAIGRRTANEAARSDPEADLTALSAEWHGIVAEIRALRWLEARLGGGFDTDHYHRRRDKGSTIIVQDGIHKVVEDRR